MEKNLFKVIASVVLFVTLLSSCNKSTDTKQVYADSYINAIYNRAGVPVYSIMHTAYSFSKLSSVSVKGTLSPAQTLTDPTGLGLSFYTAVDTTKYSTVLPSPDTFTYSALYSSGETATLTDAVPSNTLPPVQQLVATATSTDISLTWNANANAQAYKVRIFNMDPTAPASIIYESDFLTPKDAVTGLSIPYSRSNFIQYSLTYIRFEVSSFIFQKDQNTFDAVSVATTKNIVGL